MDIFQTIQKKVNKIAKETYKLDDDPPEFIVSLLYEKAENGAKDIDHKIVLTVKHCGFSFSKVIFPQTSQRYGYESLEDEMKYMYNKTI